MNLRINFVHAARALGALAATLLPLAVTAATLDDLLRETRAPATWRAAPAAELHDAEQAFGAMLTAPDDAATAARWQALGFEVRSVRLAARSFLLVRERPAQRHGRGAYLFRIGSTSRWTLQAPHNPTDRYTGRIAARLAVQGDFRVVAWNTVRRRHRQGGATIDADLSHLPASYFTALARAIATRLPDGGTLELHGFTPARRQTDAARDADFIVSAARRTPTPRAAQLATCLRDARIGAVALYPRDVTELGGTTNAIARTLHAHGHAGFVHLEMSPPARRRLVQSRAARGTLLTCLP